ncbi:MAG: 50S ribosomal protein L31 [Candidatus Lernaella stagnicola]|nr:50S ribosomal protein L31 [Candidatus Lernaella stagnicola]
MRDKIHPKYEETHFKCACGNEFTSRSTMGKEVSIDICNKCHPFFTGREKLVDTAGRVERFMQKYKGTYGKGKKGNS